MDVKIAAFADALQGLAYLTSLDMSDLAQQFDSRLIDGLENGKAQKFEYTLEAGWKAMQAALREQEGIDEASPKKVIKAYYLAGNLTEDDYLSLIAAVDDRNKLSHLYDAVLFMAIISRLPHYAAVLTRVLARLGGGELAP